MRPPRVGISFIGVLLTEGVDKTCIEEILKTRPLFIGKAVFADILLGIGEVYFLMGDVEVAAK